MDLMWTILQINTHLVYSYQLVFLAAVCAIESKYTRLQCVLIVMKEHSVTQSCVLIVFGMALYGTEE